MSGPFGDPPPGYPAGYGRPSWAPSPAASRTSSGAIVAIFIGIFVVLALIVGVFVFLSQPPPPVAPCQPGQACAPVPSLPVVAGGSPLPVATPVAHPTPVPTSPAASNPVSLPTPGASLALPGPTPTDDTPAAISGEQFTDDSLGFGFEYDPAAWSLSDSGDGFAVLHSSNFDCQVLVDVADADTSPQQMMDSELSQIDRLLVGRVADTDTYDAVLGPSIGYVRGVGSVWSGTLVSSDGTPLEPGSVTVLSSTDGRITAAIVVIVGSPDAQVDGDTQQYDARKDADDILKTFDWGGQ